MKLFFSGFLCAMLGGLASYMLVLWLAPEMHPSNFANLIGIVAVATGLTGPAIFKKFSSKGRRGRGRHD